MGALDTSLSRVGQINKAGADDALFLKQFGGEILTEFHNTSVFKDRHFVRQIRNGKSAQFPLIGSVNSSMHTPGAWIDGASVGHAEVVLTVDGLLVAPLFVAEIDELMNHYDVRGPYSAEMGYELAQQYDKNVARTAVLAARSSSVLTGRSGGSVVSAAGMSTDSTKLAAALFSSAQLLDEKKASSMDRNCFVRPAQYYLMAQNEKLLNKFYSGSANISTGTIETVAGISLVKTNNVPSTDLSADASVLSKYRGNFSKTNGIVTQRMAVGTVQLADISFETDYESRRQGTFMVATMAVGHGVLRPDCAIELADT